MLLRQENRTSLRSYNSLNCVKELNFKRKSYEEQLEKWYRGAREHKIQTTMYDDFTSAEKLKIVSYRRRQADKELGISVSVRSAEQKKLSFV